VVAGDNDTGKAVKIIQAQRVPARHNIIFFDAEMLDGESIRAMQRCYMNRLSRQMELMHFGQLGGIGGMGSHYTLTFIPMLDDAELSKLEVIDGQVKRKRKHPGSGQTSKLLNECTQPISIRRWSTDDGVVAGDNDTYQTQHFFFQCRDVG
jgi:hypothetical protein